MKLINRSTRAIHVCGKILLPDETMDCSKEIAELPSIKAYARRKFIEIDDSEERIKEAVKKAEAEKAEAEKASPEKVEEKHVDTAETHDAPEKSAEAAEPVAEKKPARRRAAPKKSE